MAHITADEVKAIRNELKLAFPKWKFSAKLDSGSLGVTVTILKGDVDFSENFNGRKHCSVNHYYINQNWANPDAAAALNKINEIMHNAPGRAGGKEYFDKSDSMTDYFCTAFYTHLQIGSWNKDYEII